ncbi:hypothetical protein N9483_08450 [Flavobacteriaceae bacterium]|nr:hypothetical protein [Flavobacteriaceae bacterium]
MNIDKIQEQHFNKINSTLNLPLQSGFIAYYLAEAGAKRIELVQKIQKHHYVVHTDYGAFKVITDPVDLPFCEVLKLNNNETEA